MLACLVGAAGAALYADGCLSLIAVNPELSDVIFDVLGKYLLLVVAFERAAAVFVGMFRDQGRIDWSLRINRLKDILQKDSPPTGVLRQVHAREKLLVDKLKEDNIILNICDVDKPPTDAGYLGYLTASKHAYEFQRARFNSVSNRYVARAVFVAGIVMATLGLSLFDEILELNSSLEPWQKGLVRWTDIFITGGLLGGGSAGLNAMLNKVNEFLNKT